MAITMQDLVNNPEGISASDVSFNDGTVASALATKQDKLTFDTTPTASSTNPVTSGGVKTALDGKQASGDYATYGSFSKRATIKKRVESNAAIGIDIFGEDADGSQEYLQFNRKQNKIFYTTYDGTDWTTRMTFTADEDTGWLTLTLESAFTADNQSGYGVKYRKKNGVVYINATIKTTGSIAAKTHNIIGTLPTGFRPSSDNSMINSTFAIGGDGTSAIDAQFQVYASGQIELYPLFAVQEGVWLLGSVSFPV